MLIDDEYAETNHRNPDRRQNGDMKIEKIEEPRNYVQAKKEVRLRD